MSPRIASVAAALSSSGAAKLGKPWARLIARCSRARRVMPRITDSRKPWVLRAVVIPGTYHAQGDPGPLTGTAAPSRAVRARDRSRSGRPGRYTAHRTHPDGPSDAPTPTSALDRLTRSEGPVRDRRLSGCECAQCRSSVADRTEPGTARPRQ